MARKSRGKGRSKGAISKSYESIKKIAQLEHLDGLSYIHRVDVESNWKLLNSEEAEAEREHAALLESYYFGGGNRFDLVFNLWFGDEPGGIMDSKIMPGTDWKAKAKEADDHRRNFRSGTRMRPGSKEELSGNLYKIFARLTPWNASAAGKYLSRADTKKAVFKLGKLLEKETGLKVLGAVVHRETDHDLHVHFIVSKIGPVVIQKKKSAPSYVKILTTAQRKIIRKDRMERGEDIGMKAVNDELKQLRKEGKIKDPEDRITVEYQRLDRSRVLRRGLESMGQQYCSKTNLWEASGRDSDVAAVQEQHRKVSFRTVVQDAAAVAPDGDPAHKYIDYWLAKQWNAAVCELLPKDIQDRLPEDARQAALRYVREGSSLPCPTLDAARSNANEIIDDAILTASGLTKIAIEQAKDIVTDAQASAATIKAQADIHAAQTRAEVEEMMSPPGVLETAEKLGFSVVSLNELRADFEKIPHSLETRNEEHYLSRLVKSGEEFSWVTSAAPIKSALVLISKIFPKITSMSVIEKLVGLFPNKIPGIVVSLGILKNPEVWKDLLSNKGQPKIQCIDEGKPEEPPV